MLYKIISDFRSQLLKPGLSILSLVPSGPKRVSALSERANKQTNNQLYSTKRHKQQIFASEILTESLIHRRT